MQGRPCFQGCLFDPPRQTWISHGLFPHSLAICAPRPCSKHRRRSLCRSGTDKPYLIGPYQTAASMLPGPCFSASSSHFREKRSQGIATEPRAPSFLTREAIHMVAAD